MSLELMAADVSQTFLFETHPLLPYFAQGGSLAFCLKIRFIINVSLLDKLNEL